MCDIRLFKSAYTDLELAAEIYRIPRNDEAFLNGIAYHFWNVKESRYQILMISTNWSECPEIMAPISF